MAEKNNPKQLTPEEAKLKAGRYCAYQERSQQQVRDRLYEYGLHRDEVEELLSWLITEGFVNEERFARAFVSGKFRVKKWGRIKILHSLKPHRLSKHCINAGLSEIDDKSYMKVIRELIHKKSASIKTTDTYVKNQKIANYMAQKGFEPDLVWSVLKE